MIGLVRAGLVTTLKFHVIHYYFRLDLELGGHAGLTTAIDG